MICKHRNCDNNLLQMRGLQQDRLAFFENQLLIDDPTVPYSEAILLSRKTSDTPELNVGLVHSHDGASASNTNSSAKTKSVKGLLTSKPSFKMKFFVGYAILRIVAV